MNGCVVITKKGEIARPLVLMMKRIFNDQKICQVSRVEVAKEFEEQQHGF